MVNKILKVLFALFCIVMFFYLALPGYSFPEALPGSLQSNEPADLETPLRRGYFTNLNRAEVLAWYGAQINHSSFLGLKLPTLLLNYPPEDAQTLIRDQTGSSYLQQYVHPFRESWYINGLETPKTNLRPRFYVDGRFWEEKIIVRYIPSNIWVREIVFAATVFMIVVIYKAYLSTFRRKNE